MTILTQYSSLSPDEFRNLVDRQLPDDWPLATEIKERLRTWFAGEEEFQGNIITQEELNDRDTMIETLQTQLNEAQEIVDSLSNVRITYGAISITVAEMIEFVARNDRLNRLIQKHKQKKLNGLDSDNAA